MTSVKLGLELGSWKQQAAVALEHVLLHEVDQPARDLKV